jgi:hypothetical protein
MQANPLLTLVTGAAIVAGVSWTMLSTAAKKRMIDLRGDRKRTCPSCGRRIAGRVCDRH